MELKKLLAVGAIAAALAVGAGAQGVKPAPKPSPAKQINSFSGVMELTMGYARGNDGIYRSVAGVKVPYTAVRIKVGPQPKPGQGGDLQAGVAYRNDTEGSYFFSGPEFPMPSALDDCVMATAGRGEPWTRMTVGYSAGSTERILLRWIVFDTFASGRGAGVSAFDNPLADWGGFLTFAQPGEWKLTFDFTQVGVVVADGTFWLASQIREDIPTGEGPFRTDFWTMFSGGGVSVGSSEDTFYYDGDPSPDGVYDEMEIDHFGQTGPPALANLLLTIETGGSLTEAFPFSYQTAAGIPVSGSFIDLWFVDGSSVVTKEPTEAEFVWPISIVIDGLAPTTNITSLKFQLDARVNHSGVQMQVQLFNFRTNQYVTLEEGNAPTSFVPKSWTIGTDPRDFVGPSRQLRARIQWVLNAFEGTTPLQSWIDRSTWIVGVP